MAPDNSSKPKGLEKAQPVKKTQKKMKVDAQKKRNELEYLKKALEKNLTQLIDKDDHDKEHENRLLKDIEDKDKEMTDIDQNQNNFEDVEMAEAPSDPKADQGSNTPNPEKALRSIESVPKPAGLAKFDEQGLLTEDDIQGRSTIEGQGDRIANAGRFGAVSRLGSSGPHLYAFVAQKAEGVDDITDHIGGYHRRCDRPDGAKNVYKGKRENIANIYGIVHDWQGLDAEQALELLDPGKVKRAGELKTMAQRRKWQKNQGPNGERLSRFPVGYILVSWKDYDKSTWETLNSFRRMYKDVFYAENLIFKCATVQYEKFIASTEGKTLSEQSSLLSRSQTPAFKGVNQATETASKDFTGQRQTPDSRKAKKTPTTKTVNYPTLPPEPNPESESHIKSENPEAADEKELEFKCYMNSRCKQARKDPAHTHKI